MIKARGTFEGTSNKADYELNMQYNRLNGIVQKALQYTLNGQDKGYTLDYEYNNPKHPHAPSLIAESGKPKARNYTYDGNGNPTYYDEFKGFRSMVWDEENRLRGINDNGRLHLYTYDHTGERALKSSAESSMAVINGLASAVITHTEDYTAYVSPYFVVQKGKFTKHYFEGSSRIVSKLGEGTFSHKNTGIMAGGLDYLKRTQKEQEARDRYIKGLNIPPGPPTQHGIYATPEWTGQPYPSIDWEAISQNQEPPEGWPRYPRFNEPGDVPGPPVQFGPPVTNANVKAGHGFIPNGVEEKNLYYYHPDHLGSSSYITDKNGEVIQHTEYIAFGETFVDEHSTSNKQPYLFNGKELDFETGLYYYGARYYDAKTSLWLNVDPLAEMYPNKTPYHFVSNNPINRIDPWGLTDYIVNGERQTINDGHDNVVMKVSQRDFTRLQKKFEQGGSGYERLMNRLSVQNGYTTFESNGNSISDGITITQHKAGGDSYEEWSKNKFLDYTGKVNDIFDNIGNSLEKNSGLTRLGSNGKLYFKTQKGGVFRGNQYVKTKSLAQYGTKVTKVTGPIGYAIGAGEIGYGVYRDGGEFGYNAQVATGGVVGGMAGAWIGMKSGAYIGGKIGLIFGPKGAVIGGILVGAAGGIYGGLKGAEIGESIIK